MMWDDRAFEKEGRKPRYLTPEALKAAREAWEEGRALVCSECGKVFADERDLMEHQAE